jgi:hypothetical protein
MSDITTCTNEECPKKNGCYRYLAKPSPVMQAYCNFPFEAGECEFFVPSVFHVNER